MPRSDRKQLIEQIEKARGSRVISYVTSDRQPVPAQIGDDAVRPMLEEVRAIGHVERLDLLIYSRGGAIDVPWRIATALRATSDEWNMLVPFRANSAATLLGLGADQIVLGRQGELGPIDPIMGIQRQVPNPVGPPILQQENLNIEDVMAYGRFVRERAGLSDQEALARSLDRLAERLDAISIGNAYRTHTHIREVARRMLRSRKTPAGQQAMATIVETLAERVYAHGHAIGLSEAEEIGLPVVPAEPELDQLMWDLLGEYERDLRLLEPLDPWAAVMASQSGKHEEEWISAIVETVSAAHELVGTLTASAQRQMPPTLTVNVNVPIALPPGLNLDQLTAEAQQVLQSLLQAAQQAAIEQAQQAVQESLHAQAPIVNVDGRLLGARWRDVAD